jgi:hypothetical protein
MLPVLLAPISSEIVPHLSFTCFIVECLIVECLKRKRDPLLKIKEGEEQDKERALEETTIYLSSLFSFFFSFEYHRGKSKSKYRIPRADMLSRPVCLPFME